MIGRRLRQYGVVSTSRGGDPLYRYDLWQTSNTSWSIEVVDIGSGGKERTERTYASLDQVIHDLDLIHQLLGHGRVWRIQHAADWQPRLPEHNPNTSS